MKLEKCPVCAKKMREENGRMVCPDCGYYQVIDRSTASVTIPEPSVLPKPVSTSQSARSGTDSRTSPSPSSGPSRPAVTVSPGKQRGGMSRMTRINITLLTTFVIAFVGVTALTFYFSSKESAFTPKAPDPDAEEAAADADADDTETERLLPESECFQYLIEDIFQKSYWDVSAEELSQIRELSFYYDENDRQCIYCKMEDETPYSYYVESTIDMDYADLSCFGGVDSLTVQYGDISPGDLNGMKNLLRISSDLTPDELYEVIPDPDNIITIEIFSAMMRSCDGIERFPNLSSFATDAVGLQDISALASLPDLELLYLSDADEIHDFSPLNEMGNMRTLSISSTALQNIDFVENMPSLNFLSLYNADGLTSIEPLAACKDTMEYFYVENMSGIRDYSVVAGLPNLIELGLSVSSGDLLPSFAGLENLEYLYLSGAGDISAVASAQSLMGLSLMSCNCEDLSALSQLPNLEFLQLLEISGAPASLEPLLTLSGLRYLDISNSTIPADVTPLLGLPALQEFHMENSSVCFDFDHVPYSESLYSINMNHASFYPAGGEMTGMTIPLAGHTDLFANFPYLTELYLEDTDLTDLSFVPEDGLTDLQYLDITDNYITDLTPLADLDNLSAVTCTDNPITDTAGLDDIIIR